MNRSSVYLLFGVFIFCFAILFAQRLHLGRIRQSIDNVREQGKASELAVMSPQVRESSLANLRPSGESSFSQESEEDLEAVAVKLAKFIEEGDWIQGFKTDLSILQNFLAIIKPLKSSELLQLEEKFSANLSPGETNQALQFLLLIAGEENPLAVLTSERELGYEIRHSLFHSLVRKDLSAARRWLDKYLEEESEVKAMYLVPHYVSKLFEKDCEAGLLAAKDYGIKLESLSFTDEMIEQVRAAYVDPSYGGQKGELALMFLQSTFARNPAQAQEEADKMGIPYEELLPFFAQEKGVDLPTEQSRDYIDWMLTSAQTANQLDSILKPISNQLANWAGQDYEASAEWLSEQSPSPIRDHAIKGFVGAVSLLDLEAATLWANQIQDETLKEQVLSRSLDAWKKQNPEAAQAWEESNRP